MDENAIVKVEDEDDLTLEKLGISQKMQLNIRKAVFLFYAGKDIQEIAAQLDVHPSTVSKWLRSPHGVKLLNTITHDDKELVRAKLRDALPLMCDRLIADIEDNTCDKHKSIDKVCKIFSLYESDKDASGFDRYKEYLEALIGDSDDDDIIDIPPEDVEVLE